MLWTFRGVFRARSGISKTCKCNEKSSKVHIIWIEKAKERGGATRGTGSNEMHGTEMHATLPVAASGRNAQTTEMQSGDTHRFDRTAEPQYCVRTQSRRKDPDLRIIRRRGFCEFHINRYPASGWMAGYYVTGLFPSLAHMATSREYLSLMFL